MSFSTKLAARARTRLSQIAPGARRAISASHVQNSKKVVFSGIQPTGVPHLGNYLGALKQWVRLQDTADPDTTLLFCSVDLHAVTVPQAPAVLAAHRRQCFASLLAIGLDPSRSIVFHQSAVPAHSELMWLLSCSASVGYLSRMTQWKVRLIAPPFVMLIAIEQDQGAIAAKADGISRTAGIVFISRAASSRHSGSRVWRPTDTTVSNRCSATHVPVGEDQAQHLEFTRNCAASFNAQYREQAGDILPIPETMLCMISKQTW
jgi:tryptophanyl-tRNA synthetase